MRSYFECILLYVLLQIRGMNFKRGTTLCTLPTFPNGKVSYSLRTGMVTFRCRKKYRLLGASSAICESGKLWSDIPFCAKPGCSAEISSHHGLIVHSEQGLRMSFTCAKANHELIGNRILVCNGNSWNGSIPFCQRRSFNLSPECVPHHCPDWTSFNFEVGNETPTLGTGPLNREEHSFFYLESSKKEIASLESEEMETDQVACLGLEYLMRGATMGFIEVIQVYDHLNSDTLLKINDEQGNEWKHITVATKKPNKAGLPFYIKVLAVRGNGYLSDISIRKIQVFKSIEDCSPDKDDSLRSPVRQISPSTCFDRCHTNVSTFETLWTEGICSCDFPKCSGSEKCCSDVHEECGDKAHSSSSKHHSSGSKNASDDKEYYLSIGITSSIFIVALILGSFFVYKCTPASKEGITNPVYPSQVNSDLRSMINHRLEDHTEENIVYSIPDSSNETDNPVRVQDVFGPSCSSIESKEPNI